MVHVGDIQVTWWCWYYSNIHRKKVSKRAFTSWCYLACYWQVIFHISYFKLYFCKKNNDPLSFWFMIIYIYYVPCEFTINFSPKFYKISDSISTWNKYIHILITRWTLRGKAPYSRYFYIFVETRSALNLLYVLTKLIFLFI